MDEYYLNEGRIPVFGSWDYNEGGFPFTECFERATQAGLIPYTYSKQDHDLYGPDDLYQNNITPAMILVPRKIVWDCEMGVKEPPSPLTPSPPPPRRVAKAVDEDLYTISPHLYTKTKPAKKRMWGFLSSCLQPCCVR